jgi:hypothetical protein
MQTRSAMGRWGWLALGLLLAASASSALPRHTMARDLTGDSSYRGGAVVNGVDVVEVYRSDGSMVQTADIVGPGVYSVEVYEADTNGGVAEVTPGEPLSFRINGVPADASISSAPGGQANFQFTADLDVFDIVLDVPVGTLLASPAPVVLGAGGTAQLAISYDAGGGDVRVLDPAHASVTFASDDVSCATVDADGLITRVGTAAGSCTITATLAGGATATVTAHTGGTLAFITQPADMSSGGGTVPPIVVPMVGAMLDGVLDASYNGPISLSLAEGAGTLSGTRTVWAVGGVAGFPNIVYTAAADGESFRLRAVDDGTGYLPATSGLVSADVMAVRLAVLTQPAGSVSGFPLVTPPAVAAVDAGGGIDTDFTGRVELTETAPGTLSNGTATAVAGVATFPGLRYTATADAEAFTLTAAWAEPWPMPLPSVALQSVTSDVVATRLVLTTPAASAYNTIPMLTQPVVEAQDDDGLVDVDFTETITITAFGTGTLSGDVDVAAVQGVATFVTVQYDVLASGDAFSLLYDDDPNVGSDLPAITPSFSLPVFVPPVLSVIPPATPGTQENQTPLLQWTAACVTGNGYLVDLGAPPACESVLNDVAVALGVTQYQAPRLEDGPYCWRVAAIRTDGVEVWSTESTFHTIPVFGPWGGMLMVTAMLGLGVWYVRRRPGAA